MRETSPFLLPLCVVLRCDALLGHMLTAMPTRENGNKPLWRGRVFGSFPVSTQKLTGEVRQEPLRGAR